MKNNILIEKLKSIYEYDNNFFTFNELEKDMWRDKIHETKKRSKIYFDLENDYPVKSQRVIVIPQNQWSPTECKFKCEMYSAGGDWEIPVRYFRIQIVSGYCYNDEFVPEKDKNYIGRNSSSNSHFIFIPGKKQGNYQLQPGKDQGVWVAPNNDGYYKDIDPQANERDCWKALEEYLKEMVEKEIEQVTKEKSNEEQPQPESSQ